MAQGALVFLSIMHSVSTSLFTYCLLICQAPHRYWGYKNQTHRTCFPGAHSLVGGWDSNTPWPSSKDVLGGARGAKIPEGGDLARARGGKWLPRWLGVKNPPANAGDTGSIPGSGRSPGGGKGNPLQYSSLKNSIDRRAWWPTVHGVTKSQTGLSERAREIKAGKVYPAGGAEYPKRTRKREERGQTDRHGGTTTSLGAHSISRQGTEASPENLLKMQESQPSLTDAEPTCNRLSGRSVCTGWVWEALGQHQATS